MFAALALVVASCGRTARIEGVVADAPSSKLVVKALDLNKYQVLDTVCTDASGRFTYKVEMEKGQPEFIYVYRNDVKLASLLLNEGDKVKKGDMVAKWDPFNAVIVTETAGRIQFEDVIEGVTYRVDSDDTTGLREMIIIESKDKAKGPSAHILDENGELIRTYNFPQGRVTDHRINLTLYKLEQILNGSLDELMEALITADQAAKLAKAEN